MKNVLTYGTFDLFHHGHHEILRKCKELSDGGKLIVGVTTENFNIERGKTNVIDSYGKRCQNVLDSGLVDKVIPDISFPQKEYDIKDNNIDVVVMGSDWKGKFDYCKEWGVEVMYFDRTPNISTTLLKNKDMESYVVRDEDGNLRLFKGFKPYKVGNMWTNEQNISGEILNKGEKIEDKNFINVYKTLTFDDNPLIINSDNKIDFVVMFVDMSDGEWMDSYNEYIKTHNIPIPEINNVEVRSRDYGTLKCLFRSLELYAPWINNVFLCVQRYSQVPSWVNKKNVRVVLHEDFIPETYLPLYNAFAIQTHVHRIPGLSNKFIFSDDDSILLRNITPERFFIGNKMCQTIMEMDNSSVKGSSSKPSHYFKNNSSKVVKDLLGIKNDFYYQDDHSMHPMDKRLNEEFYNSIDIDKHITAFREKNNIFRYAYALYAFLKRRVINVSTRNSYIDFKNKTIKDVRKWMVKIGHSEQISVNDQDLNPNFDKDIFYSMVRESLYKLFPNKSKKYEI